MTKEKGKEKQTKQAISVVIPMYNRADTIEKTLDSIYEQRGAEVRIIVVDNNSEDDSTEVVERWRESRCKVGGDISLRLLSEKKPGASAARNAGLREVDTEYVLFFDSDDTMRPNLIEEAMEKIRGHRGVDMVTWQMIIHFSEGGERLTYRAPADILQRHIINCILSTQQYLARTELFRKAGGWNEGLPAWNDWELGVRLLLEHPKIVSIEEPMVDYYRRSDSITGDNYKDKRGVWELAIDAIESAIEESKEGEKRGLLRLVEYRRVILAANYAKEGDKEGGKELMEEAQRGNSKGRRIVNKLIYEYTRRGGRGAYFIFKPFL